MSMLYYLLKSSICAATLWAGYYLLLRSSLRFTLCRVYLLLCIPLSITIPVLSLPAWSAASVAPLWQVTVVSQSAESITTASPTINVALMLSIAYAAGMAYFAFLFLKQLFFAYAATYGTTASSSSRAFTFFRKIYVNKTAMSDDDYHQVLLHEQVHARQLHSADLLLAELFIVMQWFNPFAWKIKQSLAEVHEYIADRQVLTQGANIQAYKELLFKQSIGLRPEFANGFNYSLIKKRLTMITKTKTPKFMALRLLGIAMTIAALVVVFSCNQNKRPNLEKTLLGNNVNAVSTDNGNDTVIVTLKSGKVITFTASNDEVLREKLKELDRNEIQSINISAGRGKKDENEINTFFRPDKSPKTFVIVLKSGKVMTYSSHDKDVDKIFELNPKDIESMSILKTSSAGKRIVTNLNNFDIDSITVSK